MGALEKNNAFGTSVNRIPGEYSDHLSTHDETREGKKAANRGVLHNFHKVIHKTGVNARRKISISGKHNPFLYNCRGAPSRGVGETWDDAPPSNIEQMFDI